MSELRMRMDHTLYCSYKDCDANEHISQSTLEAGRLPLFWLKVEQFWENGVKKTGAFCSEDCLMKWAAERPQWEEVSKEEDE